MKRILVIADDLTGAAEIGGIGVGCGLTARIACGEFSDFDDADIIVVDTDSRHLPPSEAALRVTKALHGCEQIRFDLIYKKTDSVLRGPVAAEIDAILQLFHLRGSLLAPQNPSLGRTVRDGQYFVANKPLHQTDFANDPDHPRRTSDVRELLGPQSGKINIASSETVEDLRALSRQMQPGILPAGGADFFTSMLAAHGLTPTQSWRAIDQSGPQLFICGSASEFSAGAIRAAKIRGLSVSAMPIELFHAAGVHDSIIEQWAGQIVELLQRTGKVFVSVDQPSMPERARHVQQVLAEVTQTILEQNTPDVLWIEGGATAAAIVDVMKWRQLQVIGTLTPGVVELLAHDLDDQRLIIKPGSYAWPKGALSSIASKS